MLQRANSPFSKKDALLAFAAVEKDLQVQHPDMLYNELLAAVHKAFATRLGTSSAPADDGHAAAELDPHARLVQRLVRSRQAVPLRPPLVVVHTL